MLKIEVEIPEYDPTSSFNPPIVFGGVIETSKQDSEFVIRANANGLRLLAGHLLALAQDGVPAGTHLHYDPGMTLEDGSEAFVIERTNTHS